MKKIKLIPIIAALMFFPTTAYAAPPSKDSQPSATLTNLRRTLEIISKSQEQLSITLEMTVNNLSQEDIEALSNTQFNLEGDKFNVLEGLIGLDRMLIFSSDISNVVTDSLGSKVNKTTQPSHRE